MIIMTLQLRSQKNFWFLTIIFVLFSVASGVAGYFFYENQKKTIKEEKRDQIGAIADLKVRQISKWHKDRMADAEVIIECPFFAPLIQQFLSGPRSTKVKQEILNWMGSRQKHYQYESIHLIDSRGTVRLSVPERKEVLGPDAKALCAEAMRKKKIVFSDLYRGKIAKVVRLTLVVPILTTEGRDAIGILLLRINPDQFLYPLVQSWPTPSHSSETLLVRREGEHVVFLNELRHQTNTALTLHLSTSDEQQPRAKGEFQEEGILEEVDYRGIPVLATMRHIPDTSWFLVTKVDQEEIYAPIRRRAWFIGIVTSLLIAGAGLSVGFLWHHQCAQFYSKQYEAELDRQALARHYDYLTKYANDIILLMDQDMKIVEANDRAVESYGYSHDELLQLSLIELQSSETRPDLIVPMKQVGERDGLVFQTEHGRKDGTRFPVEISSRVIEVEGKMFYQSIIRNITERKRAEEVLRKSEYYFRSLLFNIHEDILVIDRDYRVTDVNNTLLLTVGLERDEVIGRHCYEILHDYNQPCYRYGEQCLLQAAFESGKPHNCRHIHTRMDTQSDRSKVWVDILLSPLKDEHGSVTHVIEAMRDITDLILTGEALQESEERHRTAIENSPDGVAIVQGGQPLFVNQKFVEIFGYDRPEEIVGKPLSTVLHTDDLNQFKEVNYERQKEGPITLRHEFKGIRKGGEPILIEVSATQITYRGEAASLVYLRDITERKRKEQEMAFLQEQLRQSQKMEAIGLLAGGIAHDFGNLLAIVQGYSELSLLKLPKEDPLRENIEEVKKAGGRAMDLIRRLLAFSRRQIFQTSVLDLNTILRDLEKMLRRIIGEDIELVTLLADDLGKIEADPGQIEQILLNLAVNARDAMPSGGKLTIETTNTELDKTYARSHVAVKPGRYVMVSVSDTGVGMTPEVRERVFEPFFTTKEKGKGTGLGLSTVYGIVKQSGGNIWVYSEPGYGTTFKIYLPRLDELLKREREMKIVEESPRGNETILVVEDEEKVLMMVAEILREQGYKILGAPRGENALLIAGQHKGPIHLMVTDVVMPGMNGRELAGRLAPLHSEMKVLYMSGYTDDAIVHHGVLEKGINFIQKPFTVAGLASKVRQVLDK
jgi:PAS domain S-box-containing protein